MLSNTKWKCINYMRRCGIYYPDVALEIALLRNGYITHLEPPLRFAVLFTVSRTKDRSTYRPSSSLSFFGKCLPKWHKNVMKLTLNLHLICTSF